MIPFLRSFIGASGKVVAIDLAENMIRVAKSKYDFQNVEFIVGDVLEAQLPIKYFDYIICYSMFPHFPDKRAAIVKLAQYLGENGKMVICHSQSRAAINSLHKNICECEDKAQLPPVETISGYLEESGLKAIVTIDNEEMFVVIGLKERI